MIENIKNDSNLFVEYPVWLVTATPQKFPS